MLDIRFYNNFAICRVGFNSEIYSKFFEIKINNVSEFETLNNIFKVVFNRNEHNLNFYLVSRRKRMTEYFDTLQCENKSSITLDYVQNKLQNKLQNYFTDLEKLNNKLKVLEYKYIVRLDYHFHGRVNKQKRKEIKRKFNKSSLSLINSFQTSEISLEQLDIKETKKFISNLYEKNNFF